jgi:WD40 repeat protein
MGDLDNPKTFVHAERPANPSGPFGSGSLTGSGRLAVSPDGKWVASVDMAKAPAPHIFDARTGRLEKVLPTATGTVVFSSDGRWLATGGKREIALWEVGTWSDRWRRQRTGLTTFESGVAFSGDNSLLAVTESPQRTALLDRATGRALAEFTPPDLSANAGVRLSAAGNRIVVPTLNGTILVWDLNPIRKSSDSTGSNPSRP